MDLSNLITEKEIHMSVNPIFRYNTCIESFHDTLKKELIYDIEEKSYEEMRGLLFEYIESWYNNERIQKRLGYLSLTEYLRKSS